MPYATINHANQRINGFAGFVVSTTSMPDSAAVDDWLAEASAMVDSALTKAGYTTVPATGTNDIVLLRKIVADYVAYMVMITAFVGGDRVEQFIALYGDAERFDMMLNKLEDGGILLQDQSSEQGTFTVGTLSLRLDADENDSTVY